MNELTIKFLKLCKEAGYKRVAIGVKDGRIAVCRDWPFNYENSVFASPDIRGRGEWEPKIWEILDELGLADYGCGNGQQHQVPPNTLETGIYKLKDFDEEQAQG